MDIEWKTNNNGEVLLVSSSNTQGTNCAMGVIK